MNKWLVGLGVVLLGFVVYAADKSLPEAKVTKDARQEAIAQYSAMTENPDINNPELVYFGPSASEADDNPQLAAMRAYIFNRVADPDKLLQARKANNRKPVWRRYLSNRELAEQNGETVEDDNNPFNWIR